MRPVPPTGRLRRLGWFALIYAGSLLALGAISLLIRFWIA